MLPNAQEIAADARRSWWLLAMGALSLGLIVFAWTIAPWWLAFRVSGFLAVVALGFVLLGLAWREAVRVVCPDEHGALFQSREG